MHDLVTIGLPVYKRLQHLPQALESVRAQDYPHIELIVSDNGQNGTRVKDLADQHYRKPYTFRQNTTTVPAVAHYNQLIAAATGRYYVMLCEDDEISPNYVSELVALLERHPDATVAIGRQDMIDDSGRVLRSSYSTVPEKMSSDDFIRAWCLNENHFECWVTNMARTADVQANGGYHDFPHGIFCEDALMLKLILNRSVVFSQHGTFRWRVGDQVSFGRAMRCEDIVEDVRHILRFFDTDPKLKAFANEQPSRWRTMRGYLVQLVWMIYFRRWDSIYRYRLSRSEWCRAGFAMPWIPSYYRKALPLIAVAGKDGLVAWMKKYTPWAIRAYQFLKFGSSRSEA